MVDMTKKITELRGHSDLFSAVDVIRESFDTVAKDFELTWDNTSSNSAFITIEKIKKAIEKGIKYFGLFEDEDLIGCVAIEKAEDDVFYMERLAVQPRYRHKGYGTELMDFVVEYVQKKKGKTISVGIINENKVLKSWFIDYGFYVTAVKRPKQLPFDVCFLEFDIM